MDSDRSDELLQKLNDLESKLDDIARRIDRLENPEGSTPVTPPPVQGARQQESFYSSYYPQPQIQRQHTPPQPMRPVKTAPQVPAPPKQQRDTEYLIGAKILPKAGAVMMVIGLAFLAVLAYSRGFITPWMMFWIEIAFCGAFVVTGVAKRNMREEYGQILAGVGSCGWYLVFLGGHLYYHLYSGEVLIGLFFGLSLANLGFSLWRSSQAFLALGLIGGLVTASVIPNLKSDHSVIDTWIHFLILLPAVLIIAKNKWIAASQCLWIAATVALIPILFGILPWYEKVAILYASTALCLTAFGSAYQEKEGQLWHQLPLVMLWTSGLIGLIIRNQQDGAWQYLGFAIVFSVLAFAFFRKPKVRDALLIGGLGVPLTLAPFCFSDVQTPQIFAAISIGLALIGWRFLPKVFALGALVELFLSICMYLYIAVPPLPWRTETTLVLAIVAAIVISARAFAKGYGQNETFTLSAMALSVPLVSRLSTILLGPISYHQRPEYSVAVAFIAFVYFALFLQFRTGWKSSQGAFWVMYAVALIGYTLAAEVLGTPLESSLLVPLMIPPVLALTVTPKNVRNMAISWVDVILGVLFTRLVVVLAMPFLHWSMAEATVIGAVFYSALSFILVMQLRSQWFVASGWLMLSIASFGYISEWSFDLPLNLWLTTALLACLVLGGRATVRVSNSRNELSIFLALLGWAYFSRWSWVLLAWTIPSLDSSPAVSIGWTIYFFALLALGFAYKVVQFRYLAFGVLGTTICKILLIDLATTDAMIRVAVTIVAGLVMLAASGYWYVRTKASSSDLT